MKIGILSDLHIDLHSCGTKNFVTDLCYVIKESDIRFLIIAGDISNNFINSLQIIQLIEQATQVRCLFVPGNHDLWNVKHQELNTWQIYQKLQKSPGNLSHQPYNINEDWVVIGDTGWYDYSLGDQSIPQEEFDKMELDHWLWMDKIFIRWDRPNTEVHKYFYQKLKNSLEAHKNKNIIFVTHVVPHCDFTVRALPQVWGYFNGFLGSKDYGELILSYPVRYAIFGHIHHRKQKRIGDTLFICNSLGYTKEWRYSQNPLIEISKTFKSIEI